MKPHLVHEHIGKSYRFPLLQEVLWCSYCGAIKIDRASPWVLPFYIEVAGKHLLEKKEQVRT